MDITFSISLNLVKSIDLGHTYSFFNASLKAIKSFYPYWMLTFG